VTVSIFCLSLELRGQWTTVGWLQWQHCGSGWSR